ncbi:MAG TPA: hypothetical protein VIN38_02490 [Thiobacillus sp.]
MLHTVERLESLRIPPQNRLEAIQGDRKGPSCIRINGPWCVFYLEGWRGMGHRSRRLSPGGIMAKRQIPLATPGEILREEFLSSLGVTQ